MNLAGSRDLRKETTGEASASALNITQCNILYYNITRYKLYAIILYMVILYKVLSTRASAFITFTGLLPLLVGVLLAII